MCIPTEQGKKATEAYDRMLDTDYTVEIGGQVFTKEQFEALQQGGSVTVSGNDFTGTKAPSVIDLAISSGAIEANVETLDVEAGTLESAGV